MKLISRAIKNCGPEDVYRIVDGKSFNKISRWFPAAQFGYVIISYSPPLSSPDRDRGTKEKDSVYEDDSPV